MKEDLISRSALLAAYDAAHKGPPGGARKLIEEAPDGIVRCENCINGGLVVSQGMLPYVRCCGEDHPLDWYCADGRPKPIIRGSNLTDWILDDITWCCEKECPNTECVRNLANRRVKTGLYSVAMLKGTELCSLTEGRPVE